MDDDPGGIRTSYIFLVLLFASICASVCTALPHDVEFHPIVVNESIISSDYDFEVRMPHSDELGPKKRSASQGQRCERLRLPSYVQIANVSAHETSNLVSDDILISKTKFVPRYLSLRLLLI